MTSEKQSNTGKLEADVSKVENSISHLIPLEIDAALANFTTQGLLDVFLEMLGAFQEENENRLIEIRLALQKKEANKMARTAHSLRGSFLSLGMESMANLLMELEQQALNRQTDWDLAEKFFERLDEGYHTFEKICADLVVYHLGLKNALKSGN
ncbi:Hpt domain-containing protein [bacterium]|nr:Hpt domain-containing protein [bacterium]